MKRHFRLKQRTKLVFGIGGIVLSLLAVVVPLSLIDLQISAQTATPAATGSTGATTTTASTATTAGNATIAKTSDGNLRFQVKIPKANVTAIKEGSSDYFEPKLTGLAGVPVTMTNTPATDGNYLATFNITPDQAKTLGDTTKLQLTVDTAPTKSTTQTFDIGITGADVKKDMADMKPGDAAKTVDVTKPGASSTASAGSGTIADLVGKCKENIKVKIINSIICEVSGWLANGITKTMERVFNIPALTRMHQVKLADALTWAYSLWKLMIRLADVIAILGLILIAFANILHIQLNIYAVKKILPQLIFALIFANLSWYIGSVVYAFANTLVAPIAQNSVDTVLNNVSATLGEAMGIDILIMFFNPLIAIFIGLILIAMFLVFLALGILLSIQPVVVALLLSVAPAAIVCMPFAQTSGIFSRWLKMILNWIFMWTVTILIFWIVAFILKASGESSMGNLLVVIKELLLSTVSGDVTLGDAVSSSLVKFLPLIIAVGGMAYAVRMPFALGKDVMTLLDAAKNGIGQMTKIGRSAASTAGTAYQVGKRASASVNTALESNTKARYKKGYEESRKTKPTQTMQEYLESQHGWQPGSKGWLAGGIKDRAASSLLQEDYADEKRRAISQRQAEAEHEWYNDPSQNTTNRQYGDDLEQKEKESLQKHVASKTAEVARSYDYDALLEREYETIARTEQKSVDRIREDQAQEYKDYRARAKASADAIWQTGGGSRVTDAEHLKLEQPTGRGRQAWRGTMPWSFAKPEDNMATGLSKSIFRGFIKQFQLDRHLAKLEFGLDWPSKQMEHLKGLRQETFFGTKAFEQLAGKELASKQIISEYDTKYQGWQFQDLLRAVRQLSFNMSPQHIEEMSMLSPRKVYAFAQKMGYTAGLDNLAKLYKASRELQSAGRRRNAEFTLKDMIAEGKPASRSRNLEGEMTSGTAQKPMQVEVTTRSGQRLSQRLGGEISKELAGALDELGDDIAAMPEPVLHNHIQEISSNPSLSVDAKISQILQASSQAVPARVDLTAATQQRLNTARAYQVFVHDRGGQPITLADAEKQLSSRVDFRPQPPQGPSGTASTTPPPSTPPPPPENLHNLPPVQ